jgi:hypothetical protein
MKAMMTVSKWTKSITAMLLNQIQARNTGMVKWELLPSTSGKSTSELYQPTTAATGEVSADFCG